ncbi:MAG: primosomal protein N' [Bacteroidales bacterium]|nr:primosomal protein N' [Bacteroidales bacterium]
MNHYADVVLPVPLPGLFTYALPESLATQAQAGCRVSVPFGNKRTTVGLIARLHDTAPKGVDLKTVIDLIDTSPVILPQQMMLWQWIADYYICSIGEVFKAALPAKLKALPKASRRSHSGKSAKGLSDAEATASVSPDTLQHLPASSLPVLSPAQTDAIAAIRLAWQQHPVCLLQGVTSSGKTELYIHLIDEAIRRGGQVLYLLPEIVLTSQLTDRLRAVFGERLGVYHSKFSDKERAEVWHRQLSAQPYDIIVGVRSSVFLPFQRLGLVIVDEEHEVNFKQQEPAPRYNARNVAIMMAARAGALTLLGTATPSFESYYNARLGKYGLVQLTERYGQVQLPEIEVVDVSELRRKRLMQGPFSPQLLDAMQAALQAGEQVILFQNRRGYAPQVQCHICGWVPRCPHCDVPLTLHKRSGRITCHYCGYTTEIPLQCPACENPDLRGHGFGTERIEDDLARLFPTARVARMDLDTTRTRTAYEQIIDDFSCHRTDILVGTQMVTKGLDFEHVSVVGILSADTMLHQPDFRAYERSFQMMSQVAGRAGRRQRQGRVFLQTMDANLPLIHHVVAADYEAAYREQMLERREFSYPPFTRFIIVYLKHRTASTVDALAREATLLLRRHFGTRVLGPDEPPVARIQSLYIRRIILKLEHAIPLAQARHLLLETRTQLLSQRLYSAAHIYFDVDPL